MAKVTFETCLVASIRELGTEWAEKLDFIRDHVPGRATFSLERICALAQRCAEEKNAQHLEQKTTSWAAFVDKQLKNGAATTHRMVKRDSQESFDIAIVGEGSARTAPPQPILQNDLETWRAIWERLGDSPPAP